MINVKPKNNFPVILSDVGILAGAFVVTYAVVQFSEFSVFQNIFPQSISTSLTTIFEENFWQFSISFLGIVILSRGHLWSYGICSDNLKRSIQYLFAGYVFTLIAYIVMKNAGVEFIANRYNVAAPIEDKVMLLLIQWMSSPVADQILFFGLVQTFIMKNVHSKILYWRTLNVVAVVVTTILFFVFHNALPYTTNSVINSVAVIFVGLYSSIVYVKTHSLLAAMLFQAFFFGFPYFIAFIYL